LSGASIYETHNARMSAKALFPREHGDKISVLAGKIALVTGGVSARRLEAPAALKRRT